MLGAPPPNAEPDVDPVANPRRPGRARPRHQPARAPEPFRPRGQRGHIARDADAGAVLDAGRDGRRGRPRTRSPRPSCRPGGQPPPPGRRVAYVDTVPHILQEVSPGTAFATINGSPVGYRGAGWILASPSPRFGAGLPHCATGWSGST